MNMKNIFRNVIMLFIASFGINTICNAQIIPAPQSMTQTAGLFSINEQTKLYTNLSGKEKKLMTEYLGTLPFKFVHGSASEKSNIVKLMISPLQSKNKEAYQLSVTPESVTIKANSGSGLCYGIQSLLQLSTSVNSLEVPCTEITDEPRFGHRGFMLDVSRHFFSKEFILKQLDMLAYYKINTFHFHLVDGGGWRIEIKKYPKLTQMTAYRPIVDWVKFWDEGRSFCSKNDANAYGGFYTQQDIKDIVKYAEIRHITVIPEIDMPGHSNEVLLAYPELVCQDHDYKSSFELCIGKEETFKFCENVLKEIMDLFPSKYIHIGGDEANRDRWESCRNCQKRMKDEQIDNVAELQNYFTARIEKFVNAHGRKIIGWDEILDGHVSKSATIMSWRPWTGSAEKALENGHEVIMSPTENCYLDFYQAKASTQPRAIGGFLPLHKVYDFDPAPAGTKNAEKILGVQGNLWTEFIATEDYAEYMTYPREMAIAEVGWTMPEHKSFQDFYKRVVNVQKKMKAKGYNSFDNEAYCAKNAEAWKAKHVIMIGIDGWAAKNFEKDNMTTVQEMMKHGSWTLAKRSVLPSASAINWASMFMGAGTEMEGYTKWNTKFSEIPPMALNAHHIFPTIYSILREQYPGIETGVTFDWDGIKYVVDSLAINKVTYIPEGESNPALDTEEATKYIKERKPNFLTIYYGGLDAAGHNNGWYTEPYYAYAKRLDGEIAKVIQAVKDAGIYDDTIFILTSDHGGIGKGHGGMTLDEMETPFVLFGKNVRENYHFTEAMMQFDVAATIAYIFNLDTPQVWIGRPMKQAFK